MSTLNRQGYKTIAILIATVAAGMPIWTRPMHQIDFSDPAFLGLWTGVGVLAAFTTLFFVNLKRWDLVAAFTMGYVIAVILHFIGGILIVNQVHTQLTLSLPVSMGTGIVSGLCGDLAWRLIKRKKIRKKRG